MKGPLWRCWGSGGQALTGRSLASPTGGQARLGGERGHPAPLWTLLFRRRKGER